MTTIPRTKHYERDERSNNMNIGEEVDSCRGRNRRGGGKKDHFKREESDDEMYDTGTDVEERVDCGAEQSLGTNEVFSENTCKRKRNQSSTVDETRKSTAINVPVDTTKNQIVDNEYNVGEGKTVKRKRTSSDSDDSEKNEIQYEKIDNYATKYNQAPTRKIEYIFDSNRPAYKSLLTNVRKVFEGVYDGALHPPRFSTKYSNFSHKYIQNFKMMNIYPNLNEFAWLATNVYGLSVSNKAYDPDRGNEGGGNNILIHTLNEFQLEKHRAVFLLVPSTYWWDTRSTKLFDNYLNNTLELVRKYIKNVIMKDPKSLHNYNLVRNNVRLEDMITTVRHRYTVQTQEDPGKASSVRPKLWAIPVWMKKTEKNTPAPKFPLETKIGKNVGRKSWDDTLPPKYQHSFILLRISNIKIMRGTMTVDFSIQYMFVLEMGTPEVKHDINIFESSSDDTDDDEESMVSAAVIGSKGKKCIGVRISDNNNSSGGEDGDDTIVPRDDE